MQKFALECKILYRNSNTENGDMLKADLTEREIMDLTDDITQKKNYPYN